MKKIPCGGFYVDDRLFYFIKDEETGKPILCASEDAIRGVQGPKGDKGDPFSISKIYASIEEMSADFDNTDVATDAFVIIENEVHTEDNGKLYIKGEDDFHYVTDLSTGTMIEGPQGNPGVGVPTGGNESDVLVKSSAEDYATHWQDISDNLLPTITEEEDNGKIAMVVDGKWDMKHLEFGEIVYAESQTSLGSDTIPLMSPTQVQSAYQSFITGKNVAINSVDGKKYYGVIGVDGSDADDIKVLVMYGRKYILTYNHLGYIADYKELLEGEVVTLSREYGVAPNDYGFYREWSPNLQDKVWVECGLKVVTAATMVGTYVELPATFEDTNYHVQVTAAELGTYHVCGFPIDSHSINVRATDGVGNAVAIKVYVETKGWKA